MYPRRSHARPGRARSGGEADCPERRPADRMKELLPRFCFQKRPALQVLERLPELLLRVHYDWAVPGHGLLDRLSRNQEEPDSLVPGVDRDLVAAVEEYERAVVR